MIGGQISRRVVTIGRDRVRRIGVLMDKEEEYVNNAVETSRRSARSAAPIQVAPAFLQVPEIFT